MRPAESFWNATYRGSGTFGNVPFREGASSCLQGKTLRRPIRNFLLAPLFGDKVSIRDGIVVSDTDALEYKKLTYSPALVRSARRDSVLLPLI